MNKALIGFSLAMIVLSTLHIGASMQVLFDAFIFKQSPGGPESVLADESNWLNIFRKIVQTAAVILGDSLVVRSYFIVERIAADTFQIHRCYVIWNRNWRVIVVPIFLLAVGAGELRFTPGSLPILIML